MAKLLHPFAYQRGLHRRTCDPRPGRPYADYSRYKPALRQEFQRRCVYCRRPDEPTELGQFHIDHYKPVSKAPELKCEYSNLFYACARCNVLKSDEWNDDPRYRLPNPCEHVMAEHLKYDGPEVRSRGTTHGDTALEILDLNDPIVVDWREYRIRQVRQLLAEIDRINEKRRAVERRLKSDASFDRRDAAKVLDGLSAAIQLATQDLERIAP